MKGFKLGNDTQGMFERSLWLRMGEQTGRQEAGKSVKGLLVVWARQTPEE